MFSRLTVTAIGVLLAMALAASLVPAVRGGTGFIALVIGGAVLFSALAFKAGRRAPRSGPGRWVSRGEFLCDSCKYDHPNLCSRPERPNATSCPDYRERG
jgi:hypothetical protein